ncbi:MAG: glycoside hydrolase family 3 N-terminal domain-containing protein, partial [Streptosporangiaceae bacterium]
QQLRRAGVNLNLAPVMDTVPKRLGRANKPIGYYYREYGHTPKAVAPHGMAFLRGMRSAGVQTTAKHFPGLGRVRRNTDTSYGVTDKVTTRHDAYLRPFHAAIDSSVPVVMVSAARYSEIDSRHIGLLSPTVMRGMVRGDQGFHGVIMSDSLTAAALKKVPMGRRPVRFLAAGGTVALTVQMPTIPTMTGAVLKRARNHPQFRTKVNAAARKVLQVKDRIGLLPCSPTPSPHAPCTIFGAPGKDRLVGTAHADVLCAGRGDDHIAAKGGNDVVNGGPGDDYIDGGAGDDILIGWSGADRIHGKGGSDVLRGKAGRDFLSSGGGPDKLYGGPAADTLLGWSGNDHLVGWGGADTLRGGTGRDTLHGMTGRDVLEGGYGVDTLFGDRHDDKLYGGPHNDVLHGWKGRDLLDGGRGVHDTCDGGPGNDRFRHCEG